MACSLLLSCEIHWYELGLNPRVAKFVNHERGLAVWVFDFVHFFGVWVNWGELDFSRDNSGSLKIPFRLL